MESDDGAAPLYSSHAEDPAWTEAINAFVLSLAEKVDHLQDVEGSEDLPRLARDAGALGAEAERLGYGPLAQAAGAVAAAARNEKPDDARSALEGLTGVAQRVRRGHRGAF